METTIGRAAIAALMVAAPHLSACSPQSAGEAKPHPATVEHVDGSELGHVILTEEAIKRIGLETAVVRETRVSQAEGGEMIRKVVPYSALIYDPKGDTWVYISPEPRRFVRHPVEVERIAGDEAVLLSGPEKDSAVAAVGVAELYGAEYGVGH